jgi:hypothetical protein
MRHRRLHLGIGGAVALVLVSLELSYAAAWDDGRASPSDARQQSTMSDAAGAAGASGASGGAGASTPPVTREQLVNSVLQLRDSRIITLNIDPTPARTIVAAITIDQQPYTMRLEPHSIRAPGYRLTAQIADGSLVDVESGPVRTMRGVIEELPGSSMAASMMDDGLHGSAIMPDGTRWWFEPLRAHLPEAAANEYALYRNSDVVGHAGPRRCGNVNDQPAFVEVPAEGAGTPQVYCAEIACDADVEYFQAWGSSVTNVQAQIERVTNQMDLQYVNEVGIDHVITQIIVRTA